MASVNVPDTLVVRAQKSLREAGFPEFTLDVTKVSPAGLQDLLYAGIYTRQTAATTHVSAKAKEEKRAPTVDEFREVTEKLLSRYYAPEFVVRQRSEAAEDELSLDEQALVIALKPRFEKAGVIWRAQSEKKDKEGKVTRQAKEGRTILDVVDELGGTGDDAWEKAAREVGRQYLTKQGTDAALIPAKLDASWATIQKEAKQHLASLKLKAGNAKSDF